MNNGSGLECRDTLCSPYFYTYTQQNVGVSLHSKTHPLLMYIVQGYTIGCAHRICNSFERGYGLIPHVGSLVESSA